MLSISFFFRSSTSVLYHQHYLWFALWPFTSHPANRPPAVHKTQTPPQIHNLLTSCKFQIFFSWERSEKHPTLPQHTLWSTEVKLNFPKCDCICSPVFSWEHLWREAVIIRSDGHGLSRTSRPLHQVSFAPPLEQIIRLWTKLWQDPVCPILTLSSVCLWLFGDLESGSDGWDASETRRWWNHALIFPLFYTLKTHFEFVLSE